MARVDVWWGDARRLLPGRLGGQRIDFLFLDGLPRQYLEYLQVLREPRAKLHLCCLARSASQRRAAVCGAFGQHGSPTSSYWWPWVSECLSDMIFITSCTKLIHQRSLSRRRLRCLLSI